MHVRRALALAAALPLLLAGCSEEEPEPKMPDPLPSSSSSSPSPTAEPTPEQESPEEFIRRWAVVLRKMQTTGEVAEFLALSPDCASCRETADRVQEIYKGGGEIQWGGWTAIRIAPYGDGTDEYRAQVRSAPTRYRESPSGVWQTIRGGQVTRLLALERSGDSWVMANTTELAG